MQKTSQYYSPNASQPLELAWGSILGFVITCQFLIARNKYTLRNGCWIV